MGPWLQTTILIHWIYIQYLLVFMYIFVKTCFIGFYTCTFVLCKCIVLLTHSVHCFHSIHVPLNLPCSSDSKESACNAGDAGSIPGSRRSSGEGHGNPLQYSCLENPMDGGGPWRASPWGGTELDMSRWLTLPPLLCCSGYIMSGVPDSCRGCQSVLPPRFPIRTPSDIHPHCSQLPSTPTLQDPSLWMSSCVACVRTYPRQASSLIY